MADIKRVSPQEAFELTKDGWTYVDVRTEEEFVEGHPEGSFNVPISLMAGGSMVPNADFVVHVEKAFGKDAKLVVGCKAGGRSLRAAQALVGAGFTQIIDQRAGWDGARNAFGQLDPGWSRVGLPTSKGADVQRGYAAVKAKG